MITTEETGRVGLITLDRPDKRNAFTRAMYTGLARALRGYDAREDIAVIVVRGAGGHFSSGNDVHEFLSDEPIDGRVMSDPEQSPAADAVHALIDCDTPLLGAVEGSAIGFGATILLHFDRVVMGKGAYLLYPFVDLAVVPEAGSSTLLARAVGGLTARKVLLDPARIFADEALRIGLATDVCDEGAAFTATMEIAERMSTRSLSAMKASKQLLRGDRDALIEQVTREFETFTERLGMDETRDRLHSLMKRHA